VTSVPAPATPRRMLYAALGLAGLYLIAIVAMASLGYFGFIWKTVVLPSILLLALLGGRLRRFIVDWGPFLGAVLLFDSLRGFVYSATIHLRRPSYAVYAIDAERWCLGGTTLPELMQGAWLPDKVGAFEKALVVIHASHFLVFLFFGVLVWVLRPNQFKAFTVPLLLILGVGLTLYWLVPTVPPWMAYGRYRLIPETRHVTAEIYNLAIPSLRASFDVNPIAAMPSLHAAIPASLTMTALRLFRGRGAWMLPYFLAVLVSITYLGEHYLVDVLAGLALAVAAQAAFVIGRKRLVSRRPEHPDREADSGTLSTRALRVPLLVTLLLLISSEAVGIWAVEWRGRLVIDEDFVERELAGRSPVGDLYHAQAAYQRGALDKAEQALLQLRKRDEHGELAQPATALAAQVAFAKGEPARTVELLSRGPDTRLPAELLSLKALALARIGRRAEVAQVLEQLRRRSEMTPLAIEVYIKTAVTLGEKEPSKLREALERLRAAGRDSEALARHAQALTLWLKARGITL
jgi:hypothetical protein